MKIIVDVDDVRRLRVGHDTIISRTRSDFLGIAGADSVKSGMATLEGKPNSGGRVERIARAIRTIERDRKIGKGELLQLIGVGSESSFKRIKAHFKRLGLPLTYAKDGYYHVPAAASFARHGIDARQRAQFAQMRASLSALGGVARDALADILEVLEATIALDDPGAFAVVTSQHPQPAGGADFYEALDRALTAVREHRWLSFRYARTAGGAPTERTIAPYAVHAHDGRYYVWGTREGDAAAFPEPRMFAVDRMSDVTIESDTFAVDPSLDLGDALRYTFGALVSTDPPEIVVVRFAPEAAAFVACRRWPAQRDVRTDADGSLRLTFAVSKTDELVAWVLGFGGAATIVSPASAREQLIARAEAAIAAAHAVTLEPSLG
jgi:predicted DNA-binding transcriptional regulator YafY